MTARRATIVLNIDLARGSKEAHMVSIEKIAHTLGAQAVEIFERRGYSVRSAAVTTTLHYVRHEATRILRKPVVRRALKAVR